MKGIIVLGVVLMLVGGGLMVKGSFTVEDKHEANILGAKLSLTEKDRKPIPLAVSGTLLAAGAALTLIGAAKSRAK